MTDQVAAHGEGAEQLIVQVVAVGHDNDGRVLQFRSSNQLARVERHEKALAGTLSVPDHAHLAVAFGRDGTHRAFHGVAHGVILMIARNDLGNARSGIAEDREIADEIEEPPLFEHALDQHGHLGTALCRDIGTIRRSPWHEPFFTSGQRADPRHQAVGSHQHRIGSKQGRDL